MLIELDENEIDSIKKNEQYEEFVSLLKKMLIPSAESIKMEAALRGNSEQLAAVSGVLSKFKIEVPQQVVKLDFKQEDAVVAVNSLIEQIKKFTISNEKLTAEIRTLAEVNSADRVFDIKYGVMSRIDSITVTVKK